MLKVIAQSNLSHITDHDFERYYLGMIKDQQELAILEEHLLGCNQCVERAEESDRYVDAIRRALLRLGQDPPEERLGELRRRCGPLNSSSG